MGLTSMTGFAARSGTGRGHAWSWDLRSVNGRGLDLRFRLPDWIEGLEPAARAALAGVASRGNVTLSLRISRDGAGVDGLNRPVIARALDQIRAVQAMATEAGVTLAPPTAAEVLSLRGAADAGPDESERAALLAELKADLTALTADFAASRQAEGQALEAIISGQIARIADLTEAAQTAAEDRRADADRAFREALARVMASTDGVDPQRLHAELALLAVKSDITEEIDRLRAHVSAARDLIEQGSTGQGGAVGRKLDFLTQEFMREANTLCSKAQNPGLTAIGLDLKAVIDQMREQVQNVE
jgi:uncharacterized protein (TIGR00255 family)